VFFATTDTEIDTPMLCSEAALVIRHRVADDL